MFDQVVDDLIDSLNDSDVAGLKAYSTARRGVPGEYDGKLLARTRAEIGRDLSDDERRRIRSKFIEGIRAKP